SPAPASLASRTNAERNENRVIQLLHHGLRGLASMTRGNKAKTPSGKREYKMTVAGQLFKHLGLQMYSGAVPAISELISNAYDAMAKNVWITIPTGRAIQQQDQIVVRD